MMLSPAGAADLVVSPQNPMVEAGQSIQLSVSGAGLDVVWTSATGTISGQGQTVTYVAPDSSGIDIVTVLSGEDYAVVRITITPRSALQQDVSLENANWEIFTSREIVYSIVKSDDGASVWLGTEGGLEKRDIQTGELLRLYTTLDGLPTNKILGVTTDGSGGLYVVAYPCLVHFKTDGTFENMDPSSHGFTDDPITMPFLADNGELWAATFDGVGHLKPNGTWEQFYRGPYVMGGDVIEALCSDGSGGLWVGTTYSGLAHLSLDGTWQMYNSDNAGLPCDTVYALSSDGSGGLWVGTMCGLARFSADGSWRVYDEDNSGLPENTVKSLALDGSGGLWVGLYNGMAHLRSNGTWQTFDGGGESWLQTTSVMSLVSDTSAGLWIGTARGPGHLLADGQWQVLEGHGTELPSNQVTCLVLDDSGNLWAGTIMGLANLLADGSWRVYTRDNSDLCSSYINDVVPDGAKGVWIGTGNGLSHLRADGTWESYTMEDSGLPDYQVYALAPDGEGGIWVGTLSGGLAHLKSNGTWEVFNSTNSSLRDNWVMALAQEDDGGLWVGTYEGGVAHILSDGSWKTFDMTAMGLPNNLAYTLTLDGDGGVWVGSIGMVHLRADGSWQVWDADNSSLPEGNVQSLALDGAGGLWVGIMDFGFINQGGSLHHLQADGSWQVFDSSNSDLVDGSVDALIPDGTGGLWVGTSAGLARLRFGYKREAAAQIEDETLIEEFFAGGRAAVLIHPRGTGTNETEVQFMAAYAYRVLLARGYDNDEIYFMSHLPMVDINGDGFVDKNVVDGPVTVSDVAAGTSPRDLTVADVQTALAWAENKGALDQPLIFIFMDHGLTDELRLDPFGGVLTGDALDTMLDEYQSATGNPVVVLLEACYSGTLVDEISAQNRVVITSTGDDLAFYNNNGMLSFSRLLFSQLKRGMDFEAAFDLISRDLPTYGEPFDRQQPQLDDTGDGAANTNSDGALARTFCLNGCWGALSGDMTLESKTQSETLSQGKTVTLSVKVGITEGGIQKVWAVVLTPEVASQRDAAGFSLTPAPVVSMTQGDGGVWSGTFSGFYYKGDYVVTFMAKDNDGFVEASAPVTFTLTTGPEPPEAPPVATGGSPSASRSVYSNGDRLLVTLPDLPAGNDQYAAVSLPGGLFYFLTSLNTVAAFDGRNYYPWTGGTTAVDFTVTAGFPKGKYAVYLLRVPAGTDPATNTDAWQLGMADFTVQ